jgi:fibro-slime domain-containing protein
MYDVSISFKSRLAACALGAAVALSASCSANAPEGTRTIGAGGAGTHGTGGSTAGNGGSAAAGAGGYSQAGSGTFDIPDTGAAGSGGATTPEGGPPPGTVFIAAKQGAYALGASITGQGIANTGVTVDQQGCNFIAGVVRDFKGATEIGGGHDDFETFSGNGVTTGLVDATLGSDGKPVYTGLCEANFSPSACPFGQMSTTKAHFDQWYRATDDVNKPYIIYFQFAQNGNVVTFESTNFFPLDDVGWKNGENAHNYHFTTELHTKFKYVGGETFAFTGDDDLWVFINGKLAMDLGGLHSMATNTVNLDQLASALGIAKGNEYELELFHAERHTVASNFRVDTNFTFTDCGTVIPPDIIK